MYTTEKSVLLLIDIQYDFTPGGAVEVEKGDEIIGPINRIIHKFPKVVATKDWHPKDHVSFASNQPGHDPFDVIQVEGEDTVLWPDHCIKGARGAELREEIDITGVHLILHKGYRTGLDSYSAFFENDKVTSTGLHPYLKGLGIENVFIAGLAEDVCVFFSVMDAIKLGYPVYILSDAVKGVDSPPGRLEKNRKGMKDAGAVYITTGEVE